MRQFTIGNDVCFTGFNANNTYKNVCKVFSCKDPCPDWAIVPGSVHTFMCIFSSSRFSHFYSSLLPPESPNPVGFYSAWWNLPLRLCVARALRLQFCIVIIYTIKTFCDQMAPQIIGTRDFALS